jgi:hypothetical protein
MAVIEYAIHFGDGKPYVTTKVVGVSTNDKIRFTSNNPDAGIEYKNGSPFDAPDAPQANKPFHVGKTTTREFEVVKDLTPDNRLLFDCGVIQAVAKGHTATDSPASTEELKLVDRYTGEGTPNA